MLIFVSLNLFAGGVIKLAAMTMTLQTHKTRTPNEITLDIYTSLRNINVFILLQFFFGSAVFFLFLSLSFATLGISFYIGVPMCLFIYFFSSLFVSIQFICFHYFGGFMLAFTIYTHSIETTQSTSLLWLIRLDIGYPMSR